ncbi:hypothetical protein [Bacillus glycinifermentans]|uniref:Uncharacterized protein n=1 Tax=Bacillus glycinifermentans TaxID=1664069 RepID=A0A0T6BW91_9BACI|nr:hypothetical protein [Bacillus glycinifermentans]ATH95586.1 hypothetical protein COP00_18530 [Bacillus glycinifermentans]KRT95933.1 hypothetical protein AB447_201405 [Bacillus glycinifermentans]MEC0484312.1 hypothetical protein [Bacillus glycinifermentans]MEC3607376.1 hypothetical protein [Bacillus glycinifermentans]
MKVIGVGFLLFICLMTFSIALDFYQGMTLHEAVVNNMSFTTLELGEYVIILFYFLFLTAAAILNGRKKKKRT